MNHEESFLSHFCENKIRYLKVVQKEGQTLIYLKSTSTTATCPTCGSVSNHRHSTKRRVIQDIPMQVGEIITLIIYQYDCENEQCPQNVFNESFSFFDKSSRRTILLNQLILALAVNFTLSGAARILGELGFSINEESIARMVNQLGVSHKSNFSNTDEDTKEKEFERTTTIYDIDTLLPMAILKGDDGVVFENWLKGETEVEIVGTERANYARGIKEVLPNCLEMADRLEIMQYLITSLKDIIAKEPSYCEYVKDGVVVERINKSTEHNKFSSAPV